MNPKSIYKSTATAISTEVACLIHTHIEFLKFLARSMHAWVPSTTAFKNKKDINLFNFVETINWPSEFRIIEYVLWFC
jgi:hypothetical protein